MSHKDKNIFISHIHENDHKLGDLIGLLRRKGLQPRNYSITSDKPNNVRSERVSNACSNATSNRPRLWLSYITRDTRTSKWVNWEIETAAKMGKRIVGVWAHGMPGAPYHQHWTNTTMQSWVERREHSASNQRPIE